MVDVSHEAVGRLDVRLSGDFSKNLSTDDASQVHLRVCNAVLLVVLLQEQNDLAHVLDLEK